MARAWLEDMWFTRAPDGSKVRTQRHGQATQWRVRWYDDRRKMRARSFRTKREAEAWRAQIEHELREGSYRDWRRGQATFGEVAEEWLATRTDVTLSSKRSYRLLLDRHVLLRWALGGGHRPHPRQPRRPTPPAPTTGR